MYDFAQRWLNEQEFADVVGVTPETIDKMVKERSCPPPMPTPEGKLFPTCTVKEWLNLGMPHLDELQAARDYYYGLGCAGPDDLDFINAVEHDRVLIDQQAILINHLMHEVARLSDIVEATA